MISFDLEGVNYIYLEGIKPAILSLAIFRKLAFRGSSVLESEPFQMRSLMFIDKAKVKRSSCLIDLIMYTFYVWTLFIIYWFENKIYGFDGKKLFNLRLCLIVFLATERTILRYFEKRLFYNSLLNYQENIRDSMKFL